MNAKWLEARDQNTLTPLDNVPFGGYGTNSDGLIIRKVRAHHSHNGVFVCWNEDLNREEIYGGCAEIIYKGHRQSIETFVLDMNDI